MATKIESAAQDGKRRTKRPAVDVDAILPLYDIGGLQYVAYRVAIAAKLLDRMLSPVLAEHGLTLPLWRVIAQLGLQPTGTVRTLASGGAVDRAEASRAVRDLEARGIVRREPNVEDLRSPLFSLTASGRQLFEETRGPVSDFIAGLAKDVSEDDLQTANRVLFTITMECLHRTHAASP